MRVKQTTLLRTRMGDEADTNQTEWNDLRHKRNVKRALDLSVEGIQRTDTLPRMQGTRGMDGMRLMDRKIRTNRRRIEKLTCTSTRIPMKQTFPSDCQSMRRFPDPQNKSFVGADTDTQQSFKSKDLFRSYTKGSCAGAIAVSKALAMATVRSKGRALISVSDKVGIVELATKLTQLGYEVISTGGSARAIEDAGLPVTRVEDVTKFPEMLDGRVKTLHPGVHGGILARRDVAEHMSSLSAHEILPIDLVVVNLYPFRATVTAHPKPAFDVGVENIDIGGPAMIRAAAKNHKDVYVVTDPSDYLQVVSLLEESASDTARFRQKLAWKAFHHCAAYDSMVAEWLWDEAVGEGKPYEALTVPMTLTQSLRYGENPHQPAAFYVDSSLAEVGMGGVATAIQHHGKEMSYNNYLDADAAYTCCCDYKHPTCVIVKHTNPCGIASRDNLLEAYRLAVNADPISAFGGIVAFNTTVDAELAKEIREFRSPTDGETRMFYEIVIAPSYTEEGLAVLKGKSKTLRILEAKPRAPSGRSLRQVGGGWLYQDADALAPDEITFQCVSEVQPSAELMEDLKFAWVAVKHVKSNAITIAKDKKLLGMGSGQPNRVKSVEISLEKAGDEVKGAVLASDAFFPFSWNDSVEKACQAGVAAIAHPGGSLRDQDAVDCCNKYGVALVVTGHRHFKH